MAENLSALGVCLGSATVSMVHLKAESFQPNDSANTSVIVKPVETWRIPHGGNPKQTLLTLFEQVQLKDIARIACTGRKFRKLVNLSKVPEPEAVEYAYRYVRPVDAKCHAIVSAGGETFMVYVLDASGRIANVFTGNRCASGTGEFYIQQLRRLDISLDDVAEWSTIQLPYQVAGRCSVFCKSDCTHATNKGVAIPRITAGLCRMMADRIMELLKKVPHRHIMLTGGTTRNHIMKAFLEQEIEDLIVPDMADCFEALGAALWALEHTTKPFPGKATLFHSKKSSFTVLPPLNGNRKTVAFKTLTTGTIRPEDVCLLGLDVGSTTTKAVLMRERDDAFLASVYLRTNGDPVGAARKCYAALLEQVVRFVDPARITIIGLGVCGSGRQIAGLHALTDGVINEIIAHASAAVYFDPQVDTLFEIGGQDAKYTLIANGVPSDYAMNEACSAGTGSFLEESALESLGVSLTDIEEMAMAGQRPPNFSDQCAAFIASDIKSAVHEGIPHTDIVAGLVYSICMNYNNRVKGNRPVGTKVFMQGGVCYNKAVPLAMAALVGKPIVVPPEPGLMGAFGVALEVKRRIQAGIMKADRFDLKILSDRSVTYGESFVCNGGREKCDRKCDIAIVNLTGKQYPFGGACNRYYNLRHRVNLAEKSKDLVRTRQQLVFGGLPPAPSPNGKRIGLNRSYMVNTFYPFYSAFFETLGGSIVLPAAISKRGVDRCGAAFCFPGELSHGFFHTLLADATPPDYLFLPHFKSIPSGNGTSSSQLCPFVQGETYLLQTTFRDAIKTLEQQGVGVISPLLDFTAGFENAKTSMFEVARAIGFSRRDGRRAFEKAVVAQEAFTSRLKQLGREMLGDLSVAPEKLAVVLFGRAYNAFAPEANMGIPKKFTTRGIPVIPFDALPFEDEASKRHMYWGTGRQILQAARFVQNHPQLYGVYITNFSCGPDSFLLGYFREIMGRKPSLTLELDSHTADAGLETRVEAFLDIASSYTIRMQKTSSPVNQGNFVQSQLISGNGMPYVTTSSGRNLSLGDSQVTLLFPSMGKLATEAVAAAFRGSGFNAVAHPPADEAVLKLGRANTTCKECLPLILTTGSLLNYVRYQKKPEEVVVYFMATASGPCRFGQYSIFMEDLIRRHQISDVAMFSLSSENGYAGLKNGIERKGWWAVVVSDVMEDIRAMLLANAVEVESAMVIFEEIWVHMIKLLEAGSWGDLLTGLASAAVTLRAIPLKRRPEEVPVIGLVGEIFVRRDGLSRQWLTDQLAQKGFATICAPVAEWVHYCDYLLAQNLAESTCSGIQKWKNRLRNYYKVKFEKQIHAALADSGLVRAHPVHISSVIESARPYISPELTGEAVLTVGSSLTDIADRCCGIIAIGPFGCMPNRISEAILTEAMTPADKLAISPHNGHLKAALSAFDALPFMAIESDGSPFPHLVHAKLEAFCLQALRLNEHMNIIGKSYNGVNEYLPIV